MRTPEQQNEDLRYLRVTRDLQSFATDLLTKYRKLHDARIDASHAAAYIGLKTVDEDAAKALEHRMRVFAEARLRFRLFDRVSEYFRTGSFIEQLESGGYRRVDEILAPSRITRTERSLCVTIEHFIPAELLDTAHEIANAFHPTFSIEPQAEILKGFIDAYYGANIVSVHNVLDDVQPIATLAYHAHMAMCRMVELAILEASFERPNLIVLEADLGTIHARIDGNRVDLGKTPLRALLVAWQLGYDRWFANDKLCERVFGSAVSASDDFQRAFKAVKRLAKSLTWDIDEMQNRRLEKVVVQCTCSKEEIERFMASTSPPKNS